MTLYQSRTVSALSSKPLALWFLDHNLVPEESRRQVRAMKDKGFGGFFMHWINGGEPYMSDAWLDGLEILVKAAADEGLEAWLYDEAWCPSGFAGGKVLARRPELEACTIWHEMHDVRGGEAVQIDFDLMRLLYAVALPVVDGEPQLHNAVDLTTRAGPALSNPQPPYRHDWGYYPHAEPLLHWRQHSDTRLWRLDWTPPAGTWRLYIFCVRGALRWDATNMIDVLNPDGVQAFMSETHAVYAERFGKYFGSVIPGIMTDEYKHLPMPWNDAIPGLFRERTGKDFVQHLPALVDADLPVHRFVRSNYHRVTSDRFRESFSVPLGRWCEEHGLLLTGHISPEEDPSHEVRYTGSIAKHLESFHIPGTDHIIHAVGDAKRPVLNLGPRLASSVANQRGICRVFDEVGACCEEDISLEEFKHMCDWLMVNGVNLIAVHALIYSLDGYRKFYAGQTYSYQANLWEHMDTLSAHLDALTKCLTEFRPLRNVAVLKPQTANRVRQPSRTGKDDPESEDVDEALIELVWALLQRHIEFDLLDEDTAEEWQITDEELVLNKARYEIVIVPACDVVGSAAAAKLATWAGGGGSVCIVGPTPRVLDVWEERAWEIAPTRAANCFETVDIVEAAVPRGLRVEGPEAQHVLASDLMAASGERAAFLVNMLQKPVTVEVKSPAFSGPVSLDPRESRLLDARSTTAVNMRRSSTRDVVEITGPWSVRADKQNHVPLLALSTVVVVEEGVEKLSLVVDRSELDAVASSLRLDGETLDWAQIAWTPFYDCHNGILCVAEALTPGPHLFELDSIEQAPTIFVAGRFGAFAEGNEWRLTREPAEADAVDRVRSGYPYGRGALRFSTTFVFDCDPGDSSYLELPGRQGSIAVAVDSRHIGAVAWHPNRLPVGTLARGEHALELAVVGDSIGLLRDQPVWAGVTGAPVLVTVKHARPS